MIRWFVLLLCAVVSASVLAAEPTVVSVRRTDGTPVADALVMLFDRTGRTPVSMTMRYTTWRTNAAGMARIQPKHIEGGASVVSVSTIDGWALAELVPESGTLDLELTPCEARVELVARWRGTTHRRPSKRAIVVPLRSFVQPSRQFAIELRQEPVSTCLPPADYVAQREGKVFIGPSFATAVASPARAPVDVWPKWPPRPMPKLAATDADGLDASSALIRHIARHRVVALGENSHGSRNLVALLAEALEAGRLPETRVLAVEFDAWAARRIDAIVQAGGAKLELREQLLRSPSWPFTTEEFLELLNLMSRHNATRSPERRMRLVGLDVTWPYFAFHSLMRRLKEKDGALHDLFAPRLSPLGLPGQDLEGVLNQSVADELLHVLGELETEMNRRELLAGANLGDDTLYLRQYLESRAAPDPVAARDRFMATNALRAIDQAGEGRVLILAHNGHVRADSGDDPPSMGVHLRQRLGARYSTIGTLLASGVIRAFHPERGLSEQAIIDMGGIAGKTLEGVLRPANGRDRFFAFDELRQDKLAAAMLRHGMLMQNIGAFYAPESGALQFLRIELGKSYDGALWFSRSEATQGLAR